MGLVASLARHLNAETTLVTIVDPVASRRDRAAAFRRLLDARADVLATHGLDLRTELHAGTAAMQMQALVSGPEPALLVIGTAGSPADLEQTLARDFRWMFGRTAACAAFIVHSSPRVPVAAVL